MSQRRMAVPSSGIARIGLALFMAACSIISYFSLNQRNEITGENQHINLTEQQEVTLGLQSAPQMIQQFGGESRDRQATALVQEIGQRVVENSAARDSGYPFQFHLLADRETINAFALPGGQIFITEALLSRLETEGQLAGVLGHEAGHVIARHSAEQIAKAQLTDGLTGAAVIAAYDPNNPDNQAAARMAQLVGQVVNMKYGRADEIEADSLGVRFMAEAGYDPRAMIGVMEILRDAAGPNRQPEFFSTHPNPENRIENIQAAIERAFPNGVPSGLVQ